VLLVARNARLLALRAPVPAVLVPVSDRGIASSLHHPHETLSTPSTSHSLVLTTKCRRPMRVTRQSHAPATLPTQSSWKLAITVAWSIYRSIAWTVRIPCF